MAAFGTTGTFDFSHCFLLILEVDVGGGEGALHYFNSLFFWLHLCLHNLDLQLLGEALIDAFISDSGISGLFFLLYSLFHFCGNCRVRRLCWSKDDFDLTTLIWNWGLNGTI